MYCDRNEIDQKKKNESINSKDGPKLAQLNNNWHDFPFYRQEVQSLLSTIVVLKKPVKIDAQMKNFIIREKYHIVYMQRCQYGSRVYIQQFLKLLSSLLVNMFLFLSFSLALLYNDLVVVTRYDKCVKNISIQLKLSRRTCTFQLGQAHTTLPNPPSFIILNYVL